MITNNLKEYRLRLGLKQSEVAEKLGMKSSDRISHWEKGVAMPSVINLFKLAKLYGVFPHELYEDSVENKIN